MRGCIEPGAQSRAGRKLLDRMRIIIIKTFEKQRLELFSPLRRVAEMAELFGVPVLGGVGRSWQLFSGALACGLRAKFEISTSALEVSQGGRMEDMVRMHSVPR